MTRCRDLPGLSLHVILGYFPSTPRPYRKALENTAAVFTYSRGTRWVWAVCTLDITHQKLFFASFQRRTAIQKLRPRAKEDRARSTALIETDHGRWRRYGGWEPYGGESTSRRFLCSGPGGRVHGTPSIHSPQRKDSGIQEHFRGSISRPFEQSSGSRVRCQPSSSDMLIVFFFV